MLTIDMLKAMPHGTIFAEGEAKDEPGKLWRSGDGKEIYWAAIRGGGQLDWAVYSTTPSYGIPTSEWIVQHGDKIRYNNHIRFCVPCDNEALEVYRL